MKKLLRNDVIAVCEKLGFSAAKGWNKPKMLAKLADVAELAGESGVTLEEENLQAVLKAIIAAKGEVDVVQDEADLVEEAAPAAPSEPEVAGEVEESPDAPPAPPEPEDPEKLLKKAKKGRKKTEKDAANSLVENLDTKVANKEAEKEVKKAEKKAAADAKRADRTAAKKAAKEAVKEAANLSRGNIGHAKRVEFSRLDSLVEAIRTTGPTSIHELAELSEKIMVAHGGSVSTCCGYANAVQAVGLLEKLGLATRVGRVITFKL